MTSGPPTEWVLQAYYYPPKSIPKSPVPTSRPKKNIWSHWVDWWLRDCHLVAEIVPGVPFLWICGITHRPWNFGWWQWNRGVCVRSCPATHTHTTKAPQTKMETEHLSKWKITEITQKTHLKSFRGGILQYSRVPLAVPERKLNFGNVALLMN